MAGIYQKDMKDIGDAGDALAQLILGNRFKKQQAEQETSAKSKALQQNRAAAEEFAKSQGLKPGKFSIQASESGYGVNPESDNIMALLGLQDRQDARADRDLTKLGDRVSKENIPGTMSALANLEKGTADKESGQGMLTDPDYKVKSTGPYANFMPQFMKNVGEKVGLMPKGASNEAALIQRLMNADIRSMSGTAVTSYEQGRQNIEKGMSGAGDPDAIKLGIKQMKDAVESSANNIESSTRPNVLKQYKDQGGAIRLEDFLGKKVERAPDSGGLSEAQKQRMLHLKAKYKR